MQTTYQWLATGLWCCASKEDTDKEQEARLRAPSFGQHVVVDQPRAVSMSVPCFSSTSQSSRVHRASSRASTLTTWSKTSKASARSTIRIGEPTNFRRVLSNSDFQPLELLIHASSNNQLSPLPDFTASDWTQKPTNLEFPQQARIQRKPVLSRSTTQSSRFGAGSASSPKPLRLFPDISPSPSTHRRTSTHFSLPLTVTSAHSRRDSSCSPSRNRSNTEPAPPSLRKRPSFLSTKNEVDAAILELTTIIEERRADAYRSSANSFSSSMLPPPSPSQHVPAIAPTLRIRARSETLSDIGSAFSAPLVSKPLPLTPRDRTVGRMSPSSPPRGAIIGSEPQTQHTKVNLPSSGGIVSALRPRLSLWLRRQKQSQSSASKEPLDGQTPFYQCTIPSTRQHSHKTSFSSVSTLSSTVPSLSGRTSTSTSIQSRGGPSTPREQSLSLSMRAGRGLGKWKGGQLYGTEKPAETWGDANVNPLRLNPKSPIGVGVAY